MYFFKVCFWWSSIKLFLLCLLLPASLLIYLIVSKEIAGSSNTLLLLWWLCSSSDTLSLLFAIITCTKAGATSLRGVTSRPGNSTVCLSAMAFRCSAKQQSAHGPMTSQYSFPKQHERRSLSWGRTLICSESNPPHLAHFEFWNKPGGWFLLLLTEFHAPGLIDYCLCLCQYWIPPESLSA